MRNKMCKKIMVAMMAATLAMATVSCGAKNTGEKQPETKQAQVKSEQTKEPEKKKEIDVTTLADKLVKENSFKDELNKIDDEVFFSVYEPVEENLVSKACAYMGSGATLEQVVTVEAKDAESAKKVKEQLDSKVKSAIEDNKDYRPNEIPKLKSAVLKLSDKYVILVVSDDNSKAEKIVNKECE